MSTLIYNKEFLPMVSVKKGLSGGVVASVALGLMSCFSGLTPEQQQAGVVLSISILEILRNVLKKKFPKIFSFF